MSFPPFFRNTSLGRPQHGALWFWTGLAWLAAGAGCATSGQTGSPAEEPPDYQGPSPGGERGHGDLDDGAAEPSVPGQEETANDWQCRAQNNPAGTRSAGDLAQIHSGYWIVVPVPRSLWRMGEVAATDYRGFLVYDLRDPEQPRLVGELMLEGTPLQLIVEDGVATVVLEGPHRLDRDDVPNEPLSSTMVRVVRIDWSDPTAPRIIAETTLNGEFWFATSNGEHVSVLTAVAPPSEVRCESGSASTGGTPDAGASDVGAPADVGVVGVGTDTAAPATSSVAPAGPPPCSGTMQLTDYAVTGDEFRVEQSLEFENAGTLAFFGEGFLAPVSIPDTSEQELHLVRIDAEAKLSRLEPIESANPIKDVALRDDVLGLLVQSAAGSELRLYDVASEKATLLSTTALPGYAERLTLASDRPLALSDRSSDASSCLLDYTDPTAPLLSCLDGLAEAALVRHALVGLGTDPTGRLLVSLWGLPLGEAPSLRDELVTSWPAFNSSQQRWTLDPDAGLLVYPSEFFSEQPEDREEARATTSLGVVAVTAAELSEIVAYDPSGSVSSPRIVGSMAYAATERNLLVASLEAGGALQSMALYGDVSARVLSQTRVGDTRVELVREGNRVHLELEGATEPHRVDLEHHAQELVKVGDRVLAIGLERTDGCGPIGDGAAPAPDVAPDVGAPDETWCLEQNEAGITVIDASGEPRLERSLVIPEDFDLPEVPEDANARTDWHGYVPLAAADGLMLLASRIVSCHTEQACAKLDIEPTLGESVPGAPPCPPTREGAPADCAPVELPVSPTVEGSQQQLWAYFLDLLDPDGPRLRAGTRLAALEVPWNDPLQAIAGGAASNLIHRVLTDGRRVGFVREELLYDGDSALRNEAGDALSRFWLGQVMIEASGAFEWLGWINTPGPAISLRNGGENAYSTEPSREGATLGLTLHRLALRNGGAYILNSLPLHSGVRDVIATGRRAYFIHGPTDCQKEPAVEISSVTLGSGELERSPSLELPFDNWSFARDEGSWPSGKVLLSGGPSALGLLTLETRSDGTAPQVIRYVVE